MSLRSRRLKKPTDSSMGEGSKFGSFESVKRTTDEDFSRPFHGLFCNHTSHSQQ